MELTRVLRLGVMGEDVKYLKKILADQGYYKGTPDGKFTEDARQAVFWFQATHLGPNGLFLDADSVVGPSTWWALHNSSKDPQASKIDPIIPSGLSSDRVKVLEVATAEHKKGVREIPDGSNWGPEIQKYGGRAGWAWCALFMNWCMKQGLGKYPVDRLEPSCYYNWKAAERLGKWVDKTKRPPVPGEAFIMQYRDANGKLTGSGHTGIVIRVSSDGKLFNAIEGNVANRVKCTLRELSSSRILGYINPYATTQGDYERGVLYGNITPESLSSTR